MRCCIDSHQTRKLRLEVRQLAKPFSLEARKLLTFLRENLTNSQGLRVDSPTTVSPAPGCHSGNVSGFLTRNICRGRLWRRPYVTDRSPLTLRALQLR